MELATHGSPPEGVVLTPSLVNALIGSEDDGIGLKVVLSKELQKASAVCDVYTLDLRDCSINDFEGFGPKASKVRTLDISFNQLSDLNHLDQLKQLRELRAHNNSLGPELPELYVFDGCPNLEILYLNGNRFTQFPGGLQVLRKLRELRLSSNALTRLSPGISTLGACRSLEFLDLGGNQISSLAGLESLGGSIKTLILRDNNLKMLHPSIGQLPLLEELDLGANRLSSLKDLSRLCNKMHLSILRVDRNRLSEWKNIPRLDSLTEFYSAGNRFSSVSPLVSKFRNIDVVDLSDNRLMEEDDLFTLAECPYLFALSIQGNPVAQNAGFGERLTTKIPNLCSLDNASVTHKNEDAYFKPFNVPFTLPGGQQDEVNKENEAIAESSKSKTKRNPEVAKSGKGKTSDVEAKDGLLEGEGQSFASIYSDGYSARQGKQTQPSVSFTRSLAEKLFACDDEGKKAAPVPHASCRTSGSIFGVQQLDDVDVLFESCKKRVSAVHKVYTDVLHEKAKSGKEVDIPSISFTDKQHAEKRSKSGLHSALAFARAGDDNFSDVDDEGTSTDAVDDVAARETPRAPMTKAPLSKTRRGYRGFRIPARAQAYMRKHLDEEYNLTEKDGSITKTSKK